MIERQFVSTLKARFKEEKPLIQILMGPRQVGKTTAVLQFLEAYKQQQHYCTTDDILTGDKSWLLEQWQLALQKSNNTLLVIDEIQKIENWSDTIKKLWDEQQTKKTHIKLLISGSSSLTLTKGITESLAGRFEIIKAYHWDYVESKNLAKLNIDTFLKQGGYPKSYDFITDFDRWLSYIKHSIVDWVIDKNILQFTHVKKPSLFRQAFEIICCYPAQEISYRKLLGQIQDKGNVELIKNYLNLFEGAYLLKTLSKYTKQPFKTKSSSPKILPLAPCFYTTFSDNDEKTSFVFEATVDAKLLQFSSELYY